MLNRAPQKWVKMPIDVPSSLSLLRTGSQAQPQSKTAPQIAGGLFALNLNISDIDLFDKHHFFNNGLISCCYGIQISASSKVTCIQVICVLTRTGHPINKGCNFLTPDIE